MASCPLSDMITIIPENKFPVLPPTSIQVSCYPNPFSTSMQLTVSSPNGVVLSITDILGKQVAMFQQRTVVPARKRSCWQPDASVPAGMYWIVARGNDGVMSKPILLLR